MQRIGFLGPKGTFSQEAAESYIKGREYSLVDYSTISELIYAVAKSEIEEAVVPMENSLEGAINTTLDMLAFDVDIKIKAELVVAVRQNLLVKGDTRLEEIKYVKSHPQAVGQCRKYLSTYLPKASVELLYSTASAAREVAEGNGDSAAIGSVLAAREYGLNILAHGIQDNEINMTRFVVVSERDSGRTGHDKTSIVFSTEDRPGSLYRILDIFNLWDINMTRIESRPAKNQLGRYIFFVDVSGHCEDEDLRNALAMVKRKTSFYKFLGSYPCFETDFGS